MILDAVSVLGENKICIGVKYFNACTSLSLTMVQIEIGVIPFPELHEDTDTPVSSNF